MRFILSYMQEIPIPNAPQTLRDQIGSLAQRLTELRGQGAEAATLEARLNALVYQAYGLNAAEIALIEGNLTMQADAVSAPLGLDVEG